MLVRYNVILDQKATGGVLVSERTCKAVTLQDIADHCGVSVMTVSWALRGDSGHVSRQTARRICTAAQKLGYDRARAHVARRLRYSTDAAKAPINRLIAVTFSVELIDKAYFAEILKGIGEVVHAEGFCLLTDWSVSEGAPAPPPVVFARGEVDGAIVIEGAAVEHTIGVLRSVAGFGARPVVSLFRPVAGCSAVLADDRRGGRLLAEHLLALGHRRLARLCIGAWPHEQRALGYADALRAAGLDPAECLVPVTVDWGDPADVDAKLRGLIEARPRVTALLAGNDHLALKMAEGCARLGLRLPEDMALAGYDDTIPLPDGRGGNRLTTVRLPLHEAGRHAAETLIARVRDPDAPVSDHILPVELVVRSSTAGPTVD